MESIDIYDCYKNSPYLSIKHNNYFEIYSELFTKYKNKKIIFVEIGVLNGGSLFMWRQFFNSEARIIGVDSNPLAKRWENEGFEIHIGLQNDPIFWDNFFNIVGNVDIILDDGGHTYEQQIVTVSCCLPHINNGGLIVVEDTHTSYFRSFGYPTQFSFIEWTKANIEIVNSRFPNSPLSNNKFKHIIYSITFFESIVSFQIDRKKSIMNIPVTNDGININAEDYRHNNTVIDKLNKFQLVLFTFFKKYPLFNLSENIIIFTFNLMRYFILKYNNRKLKKYFYK
jgi:hypothetical protein